MNNGSYFHGHHRVIVAATESTRRKVLRNTYFLLSLDALAFSAITATASNGIIEMLPSPGLLLIP